jgi:hypothetical protein
VSSLKSSGSYVCCSWEPWQFGQAGLFLVKFGGTRNVTLPERCCTQRNSLMPKENSLFPEIFSLLICIGNLRKVAAAQPFLCEVWDLGTPKSQNSL